MNAPLVCHDRQGTQVWIRFGLALELFWFQLHPKIIVMYLRAFGLSLRIPDSYHAKTLKIHTTLVRFALLSAKM